MTPFDQSPSPSTADKAARIIAAAREAFLERGYDGVSMDEVAKRACVAKQTVYARYASKDALFLAVVDSVQGRVLSALSTPGPLAIRDRLQRIAEELLELLLDPSILSVSRIALAASYRFPTLGRLIYETRVRESHAVVAHIIERAAKDGCLRVDDAFVAADQFFALVRGQLHLHCVYDPSFRPSRAQIKRQVDAAIDCFMARYGAPAESSV
jgi:TetR/AcrR family transcriptional regulator, mexJK operon transcriptional repressor